MIKVMFDVPENIAAFIATGEVSKEDFDNLVVPHIKAKVNTFEELDYLLYLDTDLNQFTAAAWFQDALVGLKNLTKWNRAAIVTDNDSVKNFTSIFSIMMPGEFRCFSKNDLDHAISWCATGK